MGDQPEAIRGLVEGVRAGKDHQVLLGATGTGKTFTIASVIQELQKPALVMAHNKTLAAQLYAEFKEFFPENAVSYFVSYYDYYQPEAYVPRHDLYIEKETEINEEIERLRLAATTAPRKGGRNQQLVLAALARLWDDGMDRIVLLSAGTDGEDGPTDAAGAVADAGVLSAAISSSHGYNSAAGVSYDIGRDLFLTSNLSYFNGTFGDTARKWIQVSAGVSYSPGEFPLALW